MSLDTPTKKQILKDLSRDLYDDKEFRETINRAMDFANLKPEDLSKKIGCSIPTVKRWKAGVVVPHPIARAFIIATLKESVAITE